MWKEFKEFAFKGNVVDLAVGVMIGAAFGKIVASLVEDIFTPLLSLVTGRIDFSMLAIKFGEGEGAASLSYGKFIQSIFDFALMALCIFLLVKLIAKLRKPEPAVEAAEPRKCPFCVSEVAEAATRCPHCTSEIGAL
jgi:large conductance mechanosensitive channel